MKRATSTEWLRLSSWLIGHLFVLAKSFKRFWALSNSGQERLLNIAVLWDEESIFHQTPVLRKYGRKQPRKVGEQLSFHASSLVLVGSRNGWVYLTLGLLMLCLSYCGSLIEWDSSGAFSVKKCDSKNWAERYLFGKHWDLELEMEGDGQPTYFYVR